LAIQEYIKWSREIINTCPDLFGLSIEEDDCGALVFYSTGVYRVSFTFFVPPDIHKPTVQLRLNGKPVLSTLDSSRYLQSTNHLYSTVIYHAEQMKNITVTTFLHVCQEKSKVQVSFSNSSVFSQQNGNAQ